MIVKNDGKKRYYVYQNGKYIGKVTKKKNELSVNNHSSFYIRKANKYIEITYYVILFALIGVCSIWAAPLLLFLFMFASYIINPFDITKKTDYFIPRPTGIITLYDDHNFKTNAEVILRKRGQFLIIRFIFLVAFLTVIWPLLAQMYLDNPLPPMFLVTFAVYVPIYIIFMYLAIKKFIINYKSYKLEKIEQDKVISNL